MKFAKALLVYSHRYLGIPLSLIFIVWFFSAFFMIYTGGMPRITPEMEADGLPPIDFSQVRLSPGEAAQLAGVDAEQARLRSILGRPVYLLGENRPVLVAADSGDLLGEPDIDEGAQLASDFLQIPVDQFRFLATVTEADQWTLSNQRELPLYKYAVDDGLGTEVYVSPAYASVSVYTTQQSRLLAWLGTIPHWLYFADLRLNQPLWYNTVVWLAYAGCALALLGLVLAAVKWRRSKPFRLSQAIPYRGILRWHYILGAVFGVFTLTWIFSGLMSMEPWDWTNASGVDVDPDLYRADGLRLDRFPSMDHVRWAEYTSHDIKQVEFLRVLGTPYLLASYSVPGDAGSSKRDRLHQPYYINGQSAAQSLLINADTGRRQTGFPVPTLMARLESAVTDAAVTDFEVLPAYDDYYYSRQGQLPLPVLRVKFDDPARSWLYIDPARGEALALVHKYSRVERWLFSGLHSLDFAFWYHKRPLWDLGVILLLCGGLGISLLGFYLGVRRLWRDLRVLLGHQFQVE